ncbi:hypothetical protein GMSM_35980 [Geomonas sp. Red276]
MKSSRETTMNEQRMMHVDENARLFKDNLSPIFDVVAAASQDHVMDRLSDSLRKAVLLMAIRRYEGNGTAICRALGITRAKLQKELSYHGLPCQERRVA